MDSRSPIKKYLPIAALILVIVTAVALYLNFRSPPFSKIKRLAPLIYPVGTKMAQVVENGSTLIATLEIPISEIETFIKDNSLQETRVGTTIKGHSCLNRDLDIEIQINTQSGETTLTLNPRNAADNPICR